MENNLNYQNEPELIKNNFRVGHFYYLLAFIVSLALILVAFSVYYGPAITSPSGLNRFVTDTLTRLTVYYLSFSLVPLFLMVSLTSVDIRTFKYSVVGNNILYFLYSTVLAFGLYLLLFYYYPVGSSDGHYYPVLYFLAGLVMYFLPFVVVNLITYLFIQMIFATKIRRHNV